MFVSHGGLLSVQEALYHRTPLVGVPLGNDQKPNILRWRELDVLMSWVVVMMLCATRAARAGYAVLLDWASLSADTLHAAITRLAEDEEVRQQLRRAHDLFLDQKEPPAERAVWWVEYLARHGHAQHLKPHSVGLAWHQYHLLDVLSVIAIALITALALPALCCCMVCRKCCTRKVKKE